MIQQEQKRRYRESVNKDVDVECRQETPPATCCRILVGQSDLLIMVIKSWISPRAGRRCAYPATLHLCGSIINPKFKYCS